MVYNLRNCGAIPSWSNDSAGPAPLPSAPTGDAVVHRYAGGHKEVRKRVRDAVHELSQTYGIPFSHMAGAHHPHEPARRVLLDGQIEGCPLVRWRPQRRLRVV